MDVMRVRHASSPGEEDIRKEINRVLVKQKERERAVKKKRRRNQE